MVENGDMTTTTPVVPFNEDADKKPTTPLTKHRGRGSGGKSMLAVAGVGIEKRRKSSASSYRIENNQVVIEDEDGNTTRMEIVEISERQSIFRKSIPVFPFPLACVLCAINICLPGIGTIIAGLILLCSVGVPSDGDTPRGKAAGYDVLAGILQLLSIVIIVGWVWSIRWGVYFVTLAMEKEVAEKEKITPPKVEVSE